tara:strand:+ start:3063 stop:3365 length:303 start_codon:yes stop_codon:yes gene_type:complete
MYIIKISVIATMCMGFVQNSYYPKKTLISPIYSTKKDIFSGKIYVGEDEPIDKINNVLGKLKDVVKKEIDKILDPNPDYIPIPILIPIPIPEKDNLNSKK